MNAPCSEKSEEGIVYELFAIVGLEGANIKLELCLHKVAEGSNMSSNLRLFLRMSIAEEPGWPRW